MVTMQKDRIVIYHYLLVKSMMLLVYPSVVSILEMSISQKASGRSPWSTPVFPTYFFVGSCQENAVLLECLLKFIPSIDFQLSNLKSYWIPYDEYIYIYWLVLSTPLKNMSESSLGMIIPYILENKKCLKPPISIYNAHHYQSHFMGSPSSWQVPPRDELSHMTSYSNTHYCWSYIYIYCTCTCIYIYIYIM